MITVEIPLQEGEQHYSGKIPITLPGLTQGPVKIEIAVKPVDPNDEYYWFIKAGGLWGFETTIPRDENGEVPIKKPVSRVIERLKFYDYVITTKTKPSESPVYQEISEVLVFIDSVDLDKYTELIDNNEDAFTLSDYVIIRKE